MSIPDLDKLKRDADGMFDFLGEEAANHDQRPRKTKSDPDSFVMPIIREPVPVSESGALRAGSASATPDFNDDFDFLKSDTPAQSVEQDNLHIPKPENQEDLFEGVHQFPDERERSLQLPMLILLSTTLFVVAGAAAYWFSQNEFADLFKAQPADAVVENANEPALIEPAQSELSQSASSATPAVAPTQDSLDLTDSTSAKSTDAVAQSNTSTDLAQEQAVATESATSSDPVIDTPLPSSLYTRFSTQLESLEAMLAEGKLDEAEVSLKFMDRSVYGYGQAEFDDIQQQIVRMRGGVDAVEQAEVALAKQIESERLAAQAKAAEEARIAEQARLAEEARLAAQAKAAEEARVAEQARLAEEARLAAQAKAAEEARLAEQARLAEEARLAAQAKATEEARVAEQARLAEEARLAAQAKAAEEARLAEQSRLAEEARLAAQAKAAEEARLAEQARLAEEARLAARTKQAELAQLAEQAKQAEAARLAEQANQAQSTQQAANADVAGSPQSDEQLLLEQRAAAMLAQREKAAEAQRRAAAAKAQLEAQAQERADAARAAAAARAARERAANARLAAQRAEAQRAAATQRAAEAAAAQAARDARAAQAARAAALAEQNRLAANTQSNSNRVQPGLNIQPRQQNTPISDADFNRVAERFVELKNAIENRDITTVIALTEQSGQRVQQMLQIFENTQAVEARVSNIRSSNADGIISGTLKIQKLVKSGGLKVDAPDNLSSIRLTSNRTSSGWSPIGW